MHRSETDLLVRCADCGDEILASEERGYAAGPDMVLCSACAARRGGSWDEAQDRWSSAPDLSGLEPPGD